MKQTIDGYNCNIFIDKRKEHRYFLDIKLDNFDVNKSCSNFSKLIVIMLNPSYIEKNGKFDMTIQNIITIAKELNKSEVIILNLYPLIETKSSKLSSMVKLNERIQKNNLRVINCVLNKNKSADVLVAWGKPKNEIIEKQAEEILKEVKDRAFTFCKNTKDYPLHPKNFNLKRCMNCNGDKISLYPFKI